jgi:hypothetical protein
MMQNYARNWAEIGKRNRQAIAALGEQQEAERKRLEAWDNYTAAEFWAKQSKEIHKFQKQYTTELINEAKILVGLEDLKEKAQAHSKTKKRDRVLTGLKWLTGLSFAAAGSLLFANSVKNNPPSQPTDRAFAGFTGLAGIGLGALYALF